MHMYIYIYLFIELRQILNHQRWVYGRQDSNKEELSRKNGDWNKKNEHLDRGN